MNAFYGQATLADRGDARARHVCIGDCTVRRSRWSVSKCVQRWLYSEDYKERRRSGRPRVLNDRDVRRRKRLIFSGEYHNAQEIAANAGQLHLPPVGVSTIRRALHRTGLVARKKVKRPFHSPTHKRARLAWQDSIAATLTSIGEMSCSQTKPSSSAFLLKGVIGCGAQKRSTNWQSVKSSLPRNTPAVSSRNKGTAETASHRHALALAVSRSQPHRAHVARRTAACLREGTVCKHRKAEGSDGGKMVGDASRRLINSMPARLREVIENKGGYKVKH